jgi:CheY-like chemotaxis protein
MPPSILIVDANPGLATMLQQALSSVGLECTLALTGREAFQIASTRPIDLAIVDFHLPDGPADELIRVFQQLRPEMILLGIPPDNDPDNAAIAALEIQGALTKPFYLPDLVPQIAGLLGVQVPSLADVNPDESVESELDILKPPPPKKSSRSVPWLENAGRAAAWLDRLAEENSVPACLITRGTELHAGAGALSHEKLSLLARRVAEIWTVTPGGMIMQYVRIPPEDEEVLLFSISIALDFDLTLLFDRKTSLATARRRAKNFEKALDRPPATGTLRRTTAELISGRRKTGELGIPKSRTGELSGARRKTGDLAKPRSITDELRRARQAQQPVNPPDDHAA